MGKASMCLKMLELLNTGQVYKCSELAMLLETNSRNIIEYKKELEEAGYYITSIPGKYGGYQLEKTVLMPSLKLTEKEKNALAEGSIYLKKRNEFPSRDDYQLAVSKIFSTINHKRLEDNFLLINYRHGFDDSNLLKTYQIISDAIKNRNIIIVKYYDLAGQIVEESFHPYEFFMINDLWYVIGWSEQLADISYYQLNQVINLENTKQKFNKWKYYLRSEYLDEYGFKRLDWHQVKLIISNETLLVFKEHFIGKNLVINAHGKKHSLVEMQMQNPKEILRFALSFGKDLEICEPEWLKKI